MQIIKKYKLTTQMPKVDKKKVGRALSMPEGMTQTQEFTQEPIAIQSQHEGMLVQDEM